MANTGKKNFTGVPFGSNLYMVNPRYHNNFSTITYNGSTYPIKNILNLDKGNNAIEVEYDYDGSPMKEWITPSEDFWATNIPTDNQASIQQTGYNGLDTLDKRAQMMATRGIGTGTFTGGELQPMTNYRSSIWDYKAPSIKGPAEDIDKVMLGTLGLGIAPVAIPEVATALSTMSIPFEQTIANILANPYVQAGLTSAFAAGAAQEMPHTLQNTSAAREEFMQHPSWYTGLNYVGELGKLGLDASMFAPPTKALVQGGKQLYDAASNIGRNIADRYLFVQHPDTWTRGFGRFAGTPAEEWAMRGAEASAPRITEGNVTSVPVSSYQIEHYPGYQLGRLMRGNALEKQLSKSGTVSVNSIKAHINKGNAVEKAVVDKVLSSEQFAGKKAVDYNEFRKAVQDELITYDRVSSDKYADYGIKSLGFKNQMDSDAQSIRFNEETGEFEQIAPFAEFKPDYTLNTYTFESPRIPIGNASHYNRGTLGHSRTYTTEEEPNVLHIMESQSDWAQHKPTELLKTHDIKSLQDWEEEMAFQKANAGQGYKGVDYKQEMRDLEAARAFVDPETSYLADNYERRQIQENLKYAAEHGQTRMRYPTAETAANIEGYEKIGIETPEIRDITNRIDAIQREIDFPDPDFFVEMSQDEIRAFEKKWVKFTESEEYKNLAEELERLKNKRADLWKSAPQDYNPKHKTILKKYSSFPKQYRKLYKDAEVREVTDSKGNTWYEVDVPKDYLNQEWQYAYGGPLVRMANMFDGGGYKYYMKPSDAGYYAPEVRVTPSGSGPAAILENGDYGVTAGTLNYMGVPIYEESKELNNNQYRTMPTNAEASHFADDMVSATEFKPQHLLTAPLQGLMPLNISNWIGLADEDNNMGLAYLYSDKNPGFFIGNDPTKPFSKQFAKEHPYWAMSGNLMGDALGTLGVGKTLKTGYGKITSAYDDAKYHIDAFRENWANPYAREDMKNGLSDFWHLWKNSIKNPKQGRVLGAYTTKSYPYTGAGMYEYSAERPGRASINLGGMNTKLKDFNWDFKPETIGHYYGADGTVTSGTVDDLLQAGIEGWEPIYVDPKKIDVGALKRDIEGLPSRVGVRGDANSNTLGQQLALDYSKGNYKDMLLHFMHNTGDFNPVRVPKRGWYNVPVLGAENSAQSPAAEAMLYGIRLKNPWKFDLRYSTHPAGNFNNYATGINRPIYEAEQAYLAGNMSAEDYVELYNKWLEGIEGKFNVHNLPQDQLMRRAYVDKSGKVVKPQAWLIRKDYGGPLVHMANRYEMGGPKKKYEPYYGIYGNVSPYIGEGAPILQYDVDSDEWYSDTWSDDSKRVKQERGWYKNAPQSFKDNYWMVVDPNGDKIKYVSPEKYKAGSDWYNGRSPIFGSGSWSDNSNSYANPFEEEKIIDGKVVWPEEGEFYIDGQQIYTDGEGGGYTEYEPFTAPNSYDEGGSLNTHKKWEDLSMKERGEMIRVAIRNGITNLSDIKSKYNEFAEGGNLYGGTTQKTQQMQRRSWKTSHQQRWFAFLKRKGLSDADAARLSGFFMAQDGLESAGGTSSAARQKNNYGGMQRNGKNISYPSVEAYMEDKWNMMNSKFRSALGARTIDEYATILGNPNTAGKGYLYYVTDQAKYDPNSPVWRAAQTKHMHNYINGMRSWAGQGSVKFNDNNYSYNQNTWPQGYVYDVLPQLFAMDGVPITVSSGYRPGAVVNGTNTPSKHGMNQAADIVGDFAKIQQVLDNPNSNVSRWMLANGYGYLNETLPEIMEKTGATGKHYHIGSDSYLARQYADKFKNASPQFYEQPQGTMVPPLTPYNQEAFYGQNNTSNNQALIDMMNSIQDQYNAYQEDVRRKELAQQEAAIKQQRMQGLSTLLSMFGSMNQYEGTSPYSYMSNMLTMMPT